VPFNFNVSCHLNKYVWLHKLMKELVKKIICREHEHVVSGFGGGHSPPGLSYRRIEDKYGEERDLTFVIQILSQAEHTSGYCRID
jgi:hypothetical protein